MTDRSKHRELYPSTPWAPSRPSSDIQRSWVPARLFPPPATVWGWRWSWLCWGPRKLPSLAPSCWSGIWPWHSASSPSRLGYQTRIRVSSKQENVKSQIFSNIFFLLFPDWVLPRRLGTSGPPPGSEARRERSELQTDRPSRQTHRRLPRDPLRRNSGS